MKEHRHPASPSPRYVLQLYPFIYHGTQRMSTLLLRDIEGLREYLLSPVEVDFVTS